MNYPVIVVKVPGQSRASAYIAYNEGDLLTEEESHDLRSVHVVEREDLEDMLCAVTPHGGQTRHQAALIAVLVREKAVELGWLPEEVEADE